MHAELCFIHVLREIIVHRKKRKERNMCMSKEFLWLIYDKQINLRELMHADLCFVNVLRESIVHRK